MPETGTDAAPLVDWAHAHLADVSGPVAREQERCIAHHGSLRERHEVLAVVPGVVPPVPDPPSYVSRVTVPLSTSGTTLSGDGVLEFGMLDDDIDLSARQPAPCRGDARSSWSRHGPWASAKAVRVQALVAEDGDRIEFDALREPLHRLGRD